MQKHEAVNDLLRYILKTEKELLKDHSKRNPAEIRAVAKKVEKKLEELAENITGV